MAVRDRNQIKKESAIANTIRYIGRTVRYSEYNSVYRAYRTLFKSLIFNISIFGTKSQVLRKNKLSLLDYHKKKGKSNS